MMKAPLIVLSLSALAAAVGAQGIKGDGKFGAAGCGLGSMVFHDQAGHIQILAATTNNAVFPQTSAISTGTSNCFEDGVALKEKEQEFFASANFESLNQEMAQGKGENLQVLATLFGCRGTDVSAFSAATRTHYREIFPSSATDANQMLGNLHGMLEANPDLQAACSEQG